MNYPDAVDFLVRLGQFGIRFGLETTSQLATLCANPQRQLRFIHVAGTNGKGSTCAFLESIYRHAGLKVGLYTSPHLISFCERIQINRHPIAKDTVARYVTELEPLILKFPTDGVPTFFEATTVMALRYFADQKCDLVIWETGLGGRLDATNIVTPLASVITNIAFDHTQWLGDTLAKIAGEKAGIIKPGVPVITAENNVEPLQAIEDRARELSSPVTLVYDGDAPTEFARGLPLPLLGEHQVLNAALAIATLDTLQGIIPVSRDIIEEGLLETRWSGRLQFEKISHGHTVLLDGAHNPAGVQSLRAALEKYHSNQPRTLVLGMLADKDWAGMAKTLATLSDKILTVPVGSNRSLLPGVLAAALREANPKATVTVCESLTESLKQTAADPLVVIAGSLYLVGEAMEQIGIGVSGAHGEPDGRRLNDYGPARD